MLTSLREHERFPYSEFSVNHTPQKDQTQMRKREQTKDKIIQAALDLFVRHGYHGTSIHDITKKVGITKAAFYSHYESKRELLFRIIDEYESGYVDQLIRVVTEYDGDPISKLHHAISFNAKFALKNLELCLFLDYLTAGLNADSDFLTKLKEVHYRYRQVFRDIIAEGISQGLISKKYDPELTAVAFQALHQGVLCQWYLNRKQLDGRKYVKTYRMLFMNGLKAP